MLFLVFFVSLYFAKAFGADTCVTTLYNGIQGTCKDQAQCSGTVLTGWCQSQPSNVKCCVPDSCDVKTYNGVKGTCKDQSLCTGTVLSGWCESKPANIKCCIPSTTTSSTACPNIISRAGWGASAPSGTLSTLPKPVTYVVIHHGASAACTTQATCSSMVKSYQNLHMNTNGWSDIGYNFVVGEDGNAYEGRGWTKIGAHAPQYNSNSIGICIIGDFTSRVPNDAAVAAVKKLIQCGVNLGYVRSNYILRGHRDGYSTSCPGNTLYALIKTWSNYS